MFLYIRILLASSLFAAVSSGAIPTGLRCEYRTNPLGIDASAPRLAWTINSPLRGERQTAYQILVASTSAKLSADIGDLWKTGKVNSAAMNQIPYAGKPLESTRPYFWKVRVWDKEGRPSPWSQPATWITGFLQPSDWKAQWIAYKPDQGPNDPLPLFRKVFALPKLPARATVSVSGLGFFELRLNGRRVGENVLDPGWTNYRKTALYVTHDVTKLLRAGPNALGVMLGNGMYNVVGGRYVKFKGSFGTPKLILQLHIDYADGTSTDVVSDGTWKAAPGPILFSCIFGGEDYDARKEPQDWDTASFKDAAWDTARPVDGPGGVLAAQSAPPIRVMHTYATVKTTRPAPGVRIYDLGQNFSGWPKLTVRGPAGLTVKMTPGELLDEKGLVTQRSSGKGNSYSYTLKGKGTETWHPRFSYYGFRYVQVETTGGTPAALNIHGDFTYSSATPTGFFESSSKLLNQIQTLVQMALRSNMQSVLTDCPHREKLGWLEQAHLVAPSIFFSYDVPTLYAKIVRDMAEAQTEDGLIPDIAPEYVVFQKGFRDSPEWGSTSVIAPWLMYRWYGDKEILRTHYDVMRRYVDYLSSTAREEIITHGLGDWYDIGPKGPGESQLTPKGITATGIQYFNLRLLEEIATILGKPRDAAAYEDRAARLRAAFQKQYFHPDTRQYGTGSQTANALPLVVGLVPRDAAEGVLENLVRDIESRNNHTTAGDIGYRYVIRALIDGGRSGVLYNMATRTDAPSYGDQLKKGATSLTEAWDTNPHSSQNHFMLGHILEWFYTGLAGIAPDSQGAGFSRILIKPQPAGKLTWVNASYDSVRGRIVSNWKIQKGIYSLHVGVPANSTATVYVLSDAPDRITEGGRPAAGAAGVKFLRREGSFAVFEVGAGEYHFVAPKRT